jgi:hypothetical protein
MCVYVFMCVYAILHHADSSDYVTGVGYIYYIVWSDDTK